MGKGLPLDTEQHIARAERIIARQPAFKSVVAQFRRRLAMMSSFYTGATHPVPDALREQAKSLAGFLMTVAVSPLATEKQLEQVQCIIDAAYESSPVFGTDKEGKLVLRDPKVEAWQRAYAMFFQAPTFVPLPKGSRRRVDARFAVVKQSLLILGEQGVTLHPNIAKAIEGVRSASNVGEVPLPTRIYIEEAMTVVERVLVGPDKADGDFRLRVGFEDPGGRSGGSILSPWGFAAGIADALGARMNSKISAAARKPRGNKGKELGGNRPPSS